MSILSPNDIREKQFSTEKQGYSKHEVEMFINDIVNSYEAILMDLKQKAELNLQLTAKSQEFDSMRDALTSAMTQAEAARMASESRANEIVSKATKHAQEESEQIRVSAKNDAETIILQANETANELKEAAAKEAQAMIQAASTHVNELVSKAVANTQLLATQYKAYRDEAQEFHKAFKNYFASVSHLVREQDWLDEGKLKEIKEAEANLKSVPDSINARADEAMQNASLSQQLVSQYKAQLQREQ